MMVMMMMRIRTTRYEKYRRAGDRERERGKKGLKRGERERERRSERRETNKVTERWLEEGVRGERGRGVTFREIKAERERGGREDILGSDCDATTVPIRHLRERPHDQSMRRLLVLFESREGERGETSRNHRDHD